MSRNSEDWYRFAGLQQVECLLRPDQIRRVQILAEISGTSPSEIIRQGVDYLIGLVGGTLSYWFCEHCWKVYETDPRRKDAVVCPDCKSLMAQIKVGAAPLLPEFLEERI